MAWGIAESASEIEKIRAESSDYLGGLDSVGEIDYSLYCQLWDFYYDLLGEAYEQGLKDAPNDKRKDVETIKHGHWIEHHEPYTWMGYTYWSCSECGYECGYEKDITFITNYCPNCGAKMDEVNQGEF